MPDLREQIIDAIRTIRDPELPINIHDLGLIRDIAIEDGIVTIKMTLTTPNCPVADLMPTQVFEKVAMIEGVTSANVSLVWEPPWTVADLTKRGKAELELLDIDINHMLEKIQDNTTGLTIDKKPEN